MTITVTATSDMERLHLVSAILQNFFLPPFRFLFLFILMVACIGTDYSGCSFGDYTGDSSGDDPRDFSVDIPGNISSNGVFGSVSSEGFFLQNNRNPS